MNDVTARYVLERFLLWSDTDRERVDRRNEALDSSGMPPLAVFEAAFNFGRLLKSVRGCKT